MTVSQTVYRDIEFSLILILWYLLVSLWLNGHYRNLLRNLPAAILMDIPCSGPPEALPIPFGNVSFSLIFLLTLISLAEYSYSSIKVFSMVNSLSHYHVPNTYRRHCSSFLLSPCLEKFLWWHRTFCLICFIYPFLLPHNPTIKLEVLQEPGQYAIQVCKLATKLGFSI